MKTQTELFHEDFQIMMGRMKERWPKRFRNWLYWKVYWKNWYRFRRWVIWPIRWQLEDASPFERIMLLVSVWVIGFAVTDILQTFEVIG